ncbi:MAG: molybdopterin-dependent oxidoreductase [Alphaproteobacteria bacterium]
METKTTFCRICEALCGLEVDVDDGRVVAIRPDARHVATGGFACPKGLKQHRILGSPDRLRQPMKRHGDGFREATWEEALDDIGARVRRLVGERDPDAIAMYVGTAAGFSVLHPIFAQGFMDGIGSRSMYASATQDCANKFAVAREVYGFALTQPFPDVDRTKCLVVVGANPVVSKWSFLQVPNPSRRICEIAARGGRVWVVDPRRTETAKVATDHVFIRPDTDVYFFLSFLQELIASGGVDHGVVGRHANGFEAVAALARPWTPERTEPVTRVPAATLREIVRCYREADGAALYSSTGVNMGRHGSLAFWLQEVINAVSGNLDRRGGTLVGNGIFDFARFGKKYGVMTKRHASRLGGFTSVNDAFPGGMLADEILTPGPRQVRALFVTGGNPLITMPNAGRLREALSDLELLVCVDVWLNETASLAHWVLPATTPLQRPDLPFVFPLFLGMQARPYLQATDAVVPPEGAQLDEATIYLRLARACGVGLFGSKAALRAVELLSRLHARLHPERGDGVPQEWILSALLRLGGEGRFPALLRDRHGRLRDDHAGGDFLGKRCVTDDGRVQLAPPILLEQARALDAEFERERAGDDGRLRLITRRAVTTHNSWTHNFEEFVDGGRDTNVLYVHPADAARLGLASGDHADVISETATVRLPVEWLDELLPGTVALPHGWGHQHAKGLRVASRTRGVNVNLLAADGPDRLERVSGMAHLTGIPVEVRRASGPQDEQSWSGLSEAEERASRAAARASAGTA